jgi:hypothetical protein
MNLRLTARRAHPPHALAVTIAPYDKRDSPTFQHLPIVRYAHYGSAMADHTRRNIVVQQLLSYARLSSTDAVFFTAAANFLRRLHTRGFPINVLRACARTFYTHRAHLLPQYTQWAHFMRHLLAHVNRGT